MLTALSGEALDQIEDKVRAIPSALHYCKDHPNICNTAEFGQTSGTYASTIAANLYGRDEDNTFGFARECAFSSYNLIYLLLTFQLLWTESDIDSYIVLGTEYFRCETWGSLVTLPAGAGRGMLNLCISDVRKCKHAARPIVW